jgi:hypothetical protein
MFDLPAFARKCALLIVGSCLVIFTQPKLAFAQSTQQQQQEDERERKEKQERAREQEQERQQERQQQQEERERQRQQREEESQRSPQVQTERESSSETGRSSSGNPPSNNNNSGATNSGERGTTYTPRGGAPSSGTSTTIHTYTPGATGSGSTAHTNVYTPGSSSNGTSPSSAAGVTTYTPNARSTSPAKIEHEAGVENPGGGVTSSAGVTTYTPHAQTAGTQSGTRNAGCPQLTGDNACSVCQVSGAGSWICKSYTAGNGSPGNNSAVPKQPLRTVIPSGGSNGASQSVSAGAGATGSGNQSPNPAGQQLGKPATTSYPTNNSTAALAPAAATGCSTSIPDVGDGLRTEAPVTTCSGGTTPGQGMSTSSGTQINLICSPATGIPDAICSGNGATQPAGLAPSSFGSTSGDALTNSANVSTDSMPSDDGCFADSPDGAATSGNCTNQADQSGQPVPTDDCTSARLYVNDPNGLQADLDYAVNKYMIAKEGLKAQQALKAQLLDDSWWAASEGPVVAAQIKYYTDEMQDWVAGLIPEEGALSSAQKALLAGLKVSADSIKAAYDNSESIKGAVVAAAATAAQDLTVIQLEKIGEDVGLGPAYAGWKIIADQEEYLKTLNEAAESREIVQDQIHKIDAQIASAQNQASIAAEKVTALNALRQDVAVACYQKAITITPR